MPRRLTPGQSYSVSTGSNRPPGGRDVPRCVHVPVVERSAALARPRAHVERHRLDEPAAFRACLTGWKPPVDRDHLAPVPVGLVLQLAGLEPRIPRPLAEETCERALQVPKRLLQGHGRHLGQERQLVGLLPRGQHGRSARAAARRTRRGCVPPAPCCTPDARRRTSAEAPAPAVRLGRSGTCMPASPAPSTRFTYQQPSL